MNNVTPKITGQWASYQLNPTHNAIAPRVHLSKAWRYEGTSQINGGVAVVGDRIFADTMDGHVLAIDASTGKVIWTHKLDNVTMSTPIVADGQVFVGTGKNAAASLNAFAYAPTNNSLDFWGRPEGDHIVALNASSGKEIWSYRTAGEDMPSPVYVNDSIIFANGDGNAYALNAKSGRPIWRTALPGIATMASAMVHGKAVFLSTCADHMLEGSTTALDIRTGRVIWHAAAGNCDSSPTYGDGSVFVSGVNTTGSVSRGFRGISNVTALDPKNGRTIWKYNDKRSGPYTKVGSSERSITGTYWNGLYYQPIPTTDSLIAFDARSGRPVWRFRSSGPIKMSPVIYDNRLYVGDVSGLFYELRARDGALISTRMFPESFSTAPPVVVNSFILIANGTMIQTIKV